MLFLAAGEPERQRQRRQKSLAAGQRIHAALCPVDMIDDIQFQSALAHPVSRGFSALEVILPARHLSEPEIGPLQNPVKIRGLDVGFQHHLLFAGHAAIGCLGKRLHPRIPGFQLCHPPGFFGDALPGCRVSRKPRVDFLKPAQRHALFLRQLRLDRLQRIPVLCRLILQLLLKLKDGGPDAGQRLFAGAVRLLRRLQRGFERMKPLPKRTQRALRRSLIRITQLFANACNLSVQLLHRGGKRGRLFIRPDNLLLKLRQRVFPLGNQAVQLRPSLFLLDRFLQPAVKLPDAAGKPNALFINHLLRAFKRDALKLLIQLPAKGFPFCLHNALLRACSAAGCFRPALRSLVFPLRLLHVRLCRRVF